MFIQGSEWLFLLLPVTSKHFVQKIRKSEQRRNRRMTHSNSDSNLLEVYRHKCFRFRKNSNEKQSIVFETLHENKGIDSSFGA